ncbi:MAG: rhomboid family intramembrane serine protease [Planctomycetes bacterium]|nr:rhomboid family intramembrane serine protease [Planctomycetota bacterium]
MSRPDDPQRVPEGDRAGGADEGSRPGPPRRASFRFSPVRLLVAAFCLSYVGSALLQGRVDVVAEIGLRPGSLQGEPWRLLSYPFAYAPWEMARFALHLGLLWLFGADLEHARGGRWVVACFLASAVVAGSCHAAAEWTRPEATAPGAAGALFGLWAAYRLAGTGRPLLRVVPARQVGLLAFLLLVAAAITADAGRTAGLPMLGGMAGGWGLVRGLPWLGAALAARARRSAVRAVEREVAEEAEVDRVLARIHQAGMAALSARERRVLDRRSRRLRRRAVRQGPDAPASP